MTGKTIRPLLALCALCALFTLLAHTPGLAQTAAKRPYTEIVLDAKHSDPKAVAIATALLKPDIAKMKKYNGKAPQINASFAALGPGQPKTAVFATIDHSYYCGSQGCRTLIFKPTGNDRYDIVFDNTIGRIFTNPHQGKAFDDILSVDGFHRDGFGVFFWNDEAKAYKFVGISKFKR